LLKDEWEPSVDYGEPAAGTYFIKRAVTRQPCYQPLDWYHECAKYGRTWLASTRAKSEPAFWNDVKLRRPRNDAMYPEWGKLQALQAPKGSFNNCERVWI
jgi:hypothetical protein